MQLLETLCLVTNITSTTSVILLTIPAIQSIIESAIRPFHTANRYSCDFYTDKDGEASKQSVVASIRKIWRASNLVCAVAGGTVALLRVMIHEEMFKIDIWTQFIVWVLLLIQSTALATEGLCTARFSLGLKEGLSCLVTISTIGLEIYMRYKTGHLDNIHPYLMSLEIGLAMVDMMLSLSLPRRPDVFRNGNAVDRELTTSFLSRVSFSWTGVLIQLTTRNNDIHIDDLPELDFDTRAKSLQDSFAHSKAKVTSPGSGSVSLGKVLWLSNRRQLIYQLALSVPTSILAFGPHLSLLNILRLLEKRSEGADVTEKLWFWVLGLGVSISLSSWLETWIGWIASNKIAIRVHEQLSTVVFSKSIRMKGLAYKNLDEDKLPGENEEGTAHSTQNAVNLVAVDIPRIAGIATFFYNFVLAPMKLAVALVLLQRVLGWQSLSVGTAALALLMFMNYKCMAKYTDAGNALMSCRDHKMVALTETLQGIRQIKFSALETKWEEKLNGLRNAELQAQKTAFGWNVVSFSLWILAPILLSVASLSIYVVIHGNLTPSVAFTAISALTSTEVALSLLPELLTNTIDALISVKRIEEFLEATEKEINIIPSASIHLDNVAALWPGSVNTEGSYSESPFVLRELNVHFPQHGLSIVSGPTGSGKTMLLATILGECEILTGTVKGPLLASDESVFNPSGIGEQWIIDSAVGYVAQNPWIEAATLRDNILFGLPFDRERYKKVIFACALTRDLQILEDGDLTEIGPNGVNLSGGQKARVSLARALYSRAGILIMDDIFSAVDVHTANHLYEYALTGELAARRTRILATHHARLCLPRLDYLVCLDNGNITSAGAVPEIRRSSILDELLDPEYDVERKQPIDSNQTPAGSQNQPGFSRRSCHDHPMDPVLEQNPNDIGNPRKFVEEEACGKGAIPLTVFHRYIQKCGGWTHWVFLALCFTTFTGLVIGREWWVSIWSRQNNSTSSPETPHGLQFYLGIYIALSAVVWIIGSLRSYFALTASLRASRSLFQKVLHVVLRAPLRWLDTVPMGRILNRFSADFNLIDSRLGFDITLVLGEGMQALGALLAGILASPIITLSTAILACVCSRYARQYLTAARELKRLESISRSPIYELLGSSLLGIWTIRAYKMSQIYINRMQGLIDRHARIYWHLCLLNHWLTFRINISGAIFSTISAIIFVFQQNMSASLAGFAISFTIQLSAAMAMGIRMYVMFELEMNCVERVLEYCEIETERYDGNDAPVTWPSEGRLKVTDLTVSYAPDLPAALSKLSFQVEPNERIGIVGRTGAGKSSLALALFRFLEASEGQILIDGIDISQINLFHLRSRMAIIPQNPTLFAGTVRSNLDPFDEHDDCDLVAALERVQWTTVSHLDAAFQEHGDDAIQDVLDEKTLSSPLYTPVADGGSNFSQGQRQLLCLARAMISAPKILVLDEATSAVDNATDEVIQKSIRSDFGKASTTMLVIAHRINTVADFDRILVLDAGKAVEYGSPRDLIQLEEGVFRQMVEEDIEREHLKRVILRDD